MSSQITNKATLNYSSGSVNRSTESNTAIVTLQGPLTVTKDALDTVYQKDGTLVYNLFIKNTGPNTITNIVVTDDLGTYTLNETLDVTPLTYLNPSRTYIDNAAPAIVNGTVSDAGDSVVFNVGSLPSGKTLMLQYKCKVNEYASAIVSQSEIINVAEITADGLNTPVIATFRIPVALYADVEIVKEMIPEPLVDGSAMSYIFNITNWGTLAATDVVLRDVFTTVPAITKVLIDDIATEEYSFENGVFQYPGTASTVEYTINGATYTQDSTTGVVSCVPGKSKVEIQGTL